MLRFGIAAILAVLYGRRVLAVIDSEIFQVVIAGLVLIALIGTGYSGYRLIRSARNYRKRESRLPGSAD
jgi:hypothetical protein